MQSDKVYKLLAYFYKPLIKLYIEITAIINKHFESYIKGIYSNLSATLPQVALPLTLALTLTSHPSP
jgi:hypothetical protein